MLTKIWGTLFRLEGRRHVVGSGLGSMVVSLGLVAAFALPAMAAQGGDSNPGDVWMDTSGQPPGPGGEDDPQLPCRDINLWGRNLGDPSGTYTVDGWPPTGGGAGDQAWPGTATHPGNASWSYNLGTGGTQVISVINVAQLIANAVANGDTAANRGFHFKLQFSQDPVKHKVFWVRCAGAGGAVSGTGLGAGQVSGGGRGGGVLAASEVPALPKAGIGTAASSQVGGRSRVALALLVALAFALAAARLPLSVRRIRG